MFGSYKNRSVRIREEIHKLSLQYEDSDSPPHSGLPYTFSSPFNTKSPEQPSPDPSKDDDDDDHEITKAVLGKGFSTLMKGAYGHIPGGAIAHELLNPRPAGAGSTVSKDMTYNGPSPRDN